MKRIFDLAVSFFALLVLSPLLVPLTLMLRITGEGEIFYMQPRVGLNGKLFNIFKFATMLKNSPNIGSGTLTMRNDARVLPIGVFLRKTKINELPQLLNILFGHMSIVGPRPLVSSGEANYTTSQAIIIRSVRPGVTGIGSLMLRDEESFYAHRSDAHDFYRNEISPYKASLEIWYVENQSFLLDIQIIVFTAAAILFPNLRVEKTFSSLPAMPISMSDSKR
tara:strand:+ start:3793 stop:4458 length:666 start_codon:yes stop_codon:yes gene_type:complete